MATDPVTTPAIPVRLTITKLMVAVKQGNVEEICSSLSTYGLPANTKNLTDYIVLQYAIQHRKKEIAKLLLKAGCNVNNPARKSLKLSTPLYLAVSQGDEEITTMLLEKGAIVNILDYHSRKTPIHLAAINGSKNILQKLLDLAKNVNLRNSDVKTVLQLILDQSEKKCTTNLSYSNESQNIEIVKSLLKRGAKINLLNEYRQSPAHLAAKNKHLKILSLLLQHTKDVNSMDHERKTILYHLLDNFPSIDTGLFKELTQLVEVLVSKGTKVDLTTKQFNTALHLAAYCAGKESKILSILLKSNKMNVNIKDHFGNTILHILASELIPNIKLVKLLLTKGTKVDIKNAYLETPVLIAARNRQVPLLRELIPHVVNVNSRDREMGNTIMHHLLCNSVGVDLSEVVDELLEKGASVDIKDRTGLTPIFYAAQSQHMKVLLALLRRSKDLPGQVKMCSECKDTLLHSVLRGICNQEQNKQVDEACCEILRLLLKNGAYIDCCDTSQLMPIHEEILYKHPAFIRIFAQCVVRDNVWGNEGKTLVYYLEQLPDRTIWKSEKQVLKLTKMLLCNGASLAGVNKEGKSALDHANRCEDMLTILLRYGRDVARATDSRGNTALHLCLQNDGWTLKNFKIIVDTGVNVDARNRDGFTAMHLAANKADCEILQYLISHTKNVCEVDEHGNDVLHILMGAKATRTAAEENKKSLLDTVEVLLQKGLRVDFANKFGSTYLHLACRNLLVDVCPLLVKYGAKPQARDKLGNTCLHYVCYLGKEDEIEEIQDIDNKEVDMCKFLLAEGCDVNDRNHKGQTALHVAAEYVRTHVTGTLIRLGADINCTVTSTGATPLHIAVTNQQSRLVVYLLAFKTYVSTIFQIKGKQAHDHSNRHQDLTPCNVDVNAQLTDGSSALHIALSRPQPYYEDIAPLRYQVLVAIALLACGADPELRDRRGWTALHRACWNENLQGLVVLLEYGANINAEDNRGFTPLHYVTSRKMKHVVVWHLEKLRAAGLSLRATHQRLIDNYNLPQEVLRGFGLEIELEQMRKITLDRRTTLYDLLRMNANRLAIFQNNPVFQEVLATGNLDTRFRQYGDLIKACARRGQKRAIVLEAATESLCRLTRNRLLECCSNEIFVYLSNESLTCLIEAGCDNDRKRRLSDGKPNEACEPAKKARQNA